jgi:hypothetical protein
MTKVVNLFFAVGFSSDVKNQRNLYKSRSIKELILFSFKF